MPILRDPLTLAVLIVCATVALSPRLWRLYVGLASLFLFLSPLVSGGLVLAAQFFLR